MNTLCEQTLVNLNLNYIYYKQLLDINLYNDHDLQLYYLFQVHYYIHTYLCPRTRGSN
jgi:hypothetical protein